MRKWLRIAVFGRNLKMTLLRLLLWTVICLLIFRGALLRIEVDGISMLPTYQDHSKNWINRLAYIWHEPQRGDVVAIRMAGIHAMLLKRVIGLPGETIAFVSGQVLVNGEILEEPYEKFPYDWNIQPVTLGASQYYVVGDNRSMPEQNHTKGVCERERILGKILE
ncbi:MAG: signal peptidase I [Limisphaerales bacterium]